jgi:hypothetical protein
MKIDVSNSAVSAVTSNVAMELEETVKDRLRGCVKDFHMVIVSKGLVLRGETRSYYAKQLAQHLIMEISTMRILANDIEVVNGDEP